MPISPDSRHERPSTYFVQDRSNQDELSRLQVQDHLLTVGIGGVLPEQPDPTVFPHVLDVGCGTGGWLIELAQTTPTCTRLVGVDASPTFIAYARARAEAEQVSDRVEFHAMDALRMLEFPDATFDLVNHRFAASWLRTWDWPKLLQEYQRVCRSGGVVRVTEPMATRSNGPALSRLSELFLQAFYQAGHFFTAANEGVTGELARLLRQHGLQEVQTRICTLEYRMGDPAGERFFADLKLILRTGLPFFRKWTHVPENYEELYQQMLNEMQQPGFMATMGVMTAWGQVP
ncbi:MAG TPA: class I SAM-dependent methyltransferase [Ktedonobacteraceae bacterium]|jgi:ubiquinone/menaquinone biosynthesis C-methylase UbiE|nr:class I SAM-dependent methyltransferase [Ktedonobacteraceae bacterium]